MTIGLSSIPVSERPAVIERRLKDKTGGLGYWAAKDSQSVVNVTRQALRNQRRKNLMTPGKVR